MRLRNIAALIHARNMEFVRDKGSFIWNMALPIFLIFGFAFAFGRGDQEVFTVGVYGSGIDHPFLQLEDINFVEYDSLEMAQNRLRRHQLALLLNMNEQSYLINELSAESRVVEQLFQGYSIEPGIWQRQTISGEAIRYIDWLVPGVLAMNMMFSGLFGVGFVIVRYRKNGVLKRLKATPLQPLEFVVSQIISRVLIVVLSASVVFIGTNLFLKFVMQGSYLTLLLLAIASVTSIISLGLVFASRIKNEELAGGLLNIAVWPMMIFSGIFFSLEGTPPILQQIANIFPLTHFLQAARAVMLDGATLLEVVPNLLILFGMTLIFLLVASFLFKWE